MKCLLIFGIILTYLSILLNAVNVIPKYRTSPLINPNYPGKCWHEETKKAYRIDEEFNLDSECELWRCDTDFGFEIKKCDRLIAVEPCYLTKADLSKPYPECCAKHICPK